MLSTSGEGFSPDPQIGPLLCTPLEPKNFLCQNGQVDTDDRYNFSMQFCNMHSFALNMPVFKHCIFHGNILLM